MRAATIKEITEEQGLLFLLLTYQEEMEEDESPLQIFDDPLLTRALIHSARSDVQSQSMGSRAVRTKTRLAWDALIKLYGDETTIMSRIEEFETTHPDDKDELITLAKKYLTGWRPSEFNDD